MNFTLKNGCSFHSPHATEAIVPELLRTIWEEHNPQTKEQLLWEIFQQGSVSGDSFVKVAYEEGYQDPSGMEHPGRIRILPLNSAFCFPEYHPHDMTRLIRFKMKYRFWGTALEGTRQVFTYCVDDATEALTFDGWKSRSELTTADHVLALDPVTDEIQWEPVLAVNEFDWDAPLIRWKNRGIDALTTPNHRWITQDWRSRDPRYQSTGHLFKETEQFQCGQGRETIIAGGGVPLAFARERKWDDDFVELLGWIVTEGHYRNYKSNETTIVLTQSESANPHYVARIRRLMSVLADPEVFVFREWSAKSRPEIIRWFISGAGARWIREVLPNRQLIPEFLRSLTYHQAQILYGTLLDGDGHRILTSGRDTEIWSQKDQGRIDGFQMLCAMLGRRTHARKSNHHSGSEVTAFHSRNLRVCSIQSSEEHYTGKVWCPSVRTKTWLARRNGVTYWTGNTELWTEDAFQSFINDELIDSQENPLGVIPVIGIANQKVPSSPWGLSDIQDITDLNRQYNETATQIADIINYYASPTTVILGAKANNLERGAKKVWAIPNDKARIQNLELGTNLEGPITFLEKLKEKMHEISGIPVNAFGMEQAISNTSGVALSLQFLPLMNKVFQKNVQYSAGMERLNVILIKTAALYEPLMLGLDPTRDAPIEDGQLTMLDEKDILTYENRVVFASPLPIDKLIALNEIQMKMALGLESKEGALRTLGEAYPAEKLEELIEELHQDALNQGALDLLNAQLQLLIATVTGMGIDPETGQVAGPDQQGPNGGPQKVNSAGGPGVNSASGVQASKPSFIQNDEVKSLYQQLNTLAAGTKIPQVRNPSDPKP